MSECKRPDLFERPNKLYTGIVWEAHARTVKVNVLDGIVMRQQKAYPVYDAVYGPLLATVQDWVAGLSNFHTIGRNGLHKYNNQDHSMLTAIMAVNNVLTGQTNDFNYKMITATK